MYENLKNKLTAKQIGLLMVITEDFTKHRFPRLQQLKNKVDKGEVFTDEDMHFMQESIHSAMRNIPLTVKYQEVHEFCAHVAALYKEITKKALENERA